MITSNDFTAEDIIRIGQAYRERVIDKMRVANRILFCDTDLITTQIYSNHYLGTVPPVLYVLEEQLSFDHYFLFDIDTPWVADGLRDLENQREAMFLTFQRELEKRKITYTLLSGTWNQKFDRIRTVVDSL
jgi:HTH-type transcriptional repressor of NAD biosynthesis genes